MIVYKSTDDGPLELDTPHDASEVLDYVINYSAPVRANSTKYLLDDIVYPSTRTGIYLLCVQPGISASSEPTISTVKSTRITDGTAIWKVVHDTFLLQEGESVDSSTWVATGSVTVANDSYTALATTVFAGPVPAGVTSFTLTNTITTDSSPVRTFERSMIILVDDK